jgi:hypothetical protein
MIRSTKDIADAFAQGRWHSQRFFKNQGVTGDTAWIDWAYASGQPSYNARIGNAGEFNPYTASANQAIWFPPIPSDQERRLTSISVNITPSGSNIRNIALQFYDLLGVYPLIDGDSTDNQILDNTETLPRYTDGEGVRAVLVNHVAASTAGSSPFAFYYTDSAGVSRLSPLMYAQLAGAGKAAFSTDSAGLGRPLYLTTDGPGVRSIDEFQFGGPAPGGLWAIYMVKPIASVDWFADNAGGLSNLVPVEKDFCLMESFNLPRIYDGAHLGFFSMMGPSGVARGLAAHGSATFIWG